VSEALTEALARAAADDLVLVTGSLGMVAAAREALGIATSDPHEQEVLFG